jgi:phage-related tail protein
MPFDTAYFRDEKMQARERELMAARDDATEVDRQADQVRSTVDAIRESLPDTEAFEGKFDAMFDELPEQAQRVIQQELSRPPDTPARPASEADLQRFATTEEGAQLVKEWGKDAGKKLATVRTRFDRMRRHGGGDMEAALSWFDQLTSDEAGGVLRALAGPG